MQAKKKDKGEATSSGDKPSEAPKESQRA